MEDKKLSIAAVLIVKNEEGCIEKCVKSIAPHVEHVFLIDTGSEDATIPKFYSAISGQNVVRYCFGFEWNDNFAEARNFAKSTVGDSADYILSIDADEVLERGELLRKDVREMEEGGEYVRYVKMISDPGGNVHGSIRLFRNAPECQWEGAIHETLKCSVGDAPLKTAGVEIKYGRSKSHELDPDRNLRILTKQLEEERLTQMFPKPRTLYYIAMELFYRKNYEAALEAAEDCVHFTKWNAEAAEASLLAARCLWQMNMGKEARKKCLEAIGINPNFREALLLMSEMTYQPESTAWKNFSGLANNNNVIFIRK